MSTDKKAKHAAMHKEVIDLSNGIIQFFIDKEPSPYTRLAMYALAASLVRLCVTTGLDLDVFFEYMRVLREDMYNIKAANDTTLN